MIAKRLFIDIETIPDQRAGAYEAAMSRIKVPGNYSKPESIAKYIEERAEDEWRRTALSGMYGEVFMVAYALDLREPEVVYREVGDCEKHLLEDLWERLGVYIDQRTLWVGHNVLEFDLRFLYHRSAIHRVLPAVPLPIGATHWGGQVKDTSYMWTREKGKGVKLSELASALGVPNGVDGIDGSMVWDLVQAGEYDKLAEYCKEDVRLTRGVYNALAPYEEWL